MEINPAVHLRLRIFQKKPEKRPPPSIHGSWCRRRDSNPHTHFWITDFKSVASAISPRRLIMIRVHLGDEPTGTLGEANFAAIAKRDVYNPLQRNGRMPHAPFPGGRPFLITPDSAASRTATPYQETPGPHPLLKLSKRPFGQPVPRVSNSALASLRAFPDNGRNFPP